MKFLKNLSVCPLLLDECSSSINMELITRKKSKPLVVYEGFKFRFHKTCSMFSDGHDTIFMCYLQLSVTNKIIETQNDHNHDRCDNTVLSRQKLNNKMKSS